MKTDIISRRQVLRGIGALGIAAVASRSALGAYPRAEGVQALQAVRFAVIGDWGNGEESQYAIADRMARVHAEKPFDLILSVGDNIYPNGDYEDFGKKFERPYASLIKGKVPFYTVFGNHDVRDGREAQMRYPLFNMQGRNYYTLSRGDGLIDFFMLDSTAMDRRQVAWLERELSASSAVYKVAVVHHPPYSSGKRHGSDKDIRRAVEPLFVRHKVTAVFSGDDHIYQRVTPQQGVQYFVSGAAGKLRRGDIKHDHLVAKGFDRDNHFMVLEASTAGLAFEALDNGGRTIDAGTVGASAPALARFMNRFAHRA